MMRLQDGYEFFAGRHMITIFSAPNYCGSFNNCGAILTVDDSLRCAFITISPSKDKVKVRPSKRLEIDLDDELEKDGGEM
ncbi:unnamed protein product [Gongylonema pulchrum]|uniref:SER_THR_PHOSPHATASE domain-containing protein n=1 Tax=Gongylonema pulchrum TaxID=637853 RepID=A0A183DEE7_9BILA|nr:unnamed protein product [Gongylonema pulchrum]VDK57320.1 unnamed protein product [Gongylonema pulchrum]